MDWAALVGCDSGKSLRVEVACAHLLLSVEPIPHGSHRRVFIAELSWGGPEVFSRPATHHPGDSGGEVESVEGERGDDHVVRSVYRALRLKEYSGFVHPAGSGSGPVHACASTG